MLHDKIWDIAQTWGKYCSPARPDASEIKLVEEQLKSGMKVLLLGSTPEYRDILSKNKCLTTIVDYSHDNFLAMSRLMNNKQPQNEQFIKANWLDIPVIDKFDLIIGDHVINLLPLDQWSIFLDKIKSLLKPGATFVQRVITRVVPYNMSKEKLFLNTQSLNGPQLFPVIFYDLLMESTNKEDQTVCLADTFKLVTELRKLGFLTVDQFQYFKELSWHASQIKAYITTKEYILEKLKTFFKINSISCGEIHYKDLTFFVLSKN